MASMVAAFGVLNPLYGAQATQDPQALYNRVCVVMLMQRVTQGFKAMPPRGLCMDCSTEDYQAVIELVVSKPGR
ncbi:cytochrome [Pseudomonas sp. 910_23]|uniref:Cytochrome n=1 Tax=Pseudomonas synxantha TaxID=47883 RepID=A0A5D3G483_9PSED|nr:MULTISPECIES: cytochrome [Pseudomonas]MCK3841989.1 cytochrome [Pseudomonas sp. W15Feb34]MCK3849507.1 cytochrome [Pseudomonas sp. W2Jun17]TYK54888.1 cytochrome [Pseudomonas synxantha]